MPLNASHRRGSNAEVDGGPAPILPECELPMQITRQVQFQTIPGG